VKWAELEEAHHFVTTYCPEFREKTLGVVQEEKRKYEADAQSEENKGKHRGNQYTGKMETEDSAVSTQAARAEANGVSSYTQRNLDHLARDAPELLERVRAGELSPYAAAVAAGIVKENPLTKLRYWWRKASKQEKDAFIESELEEIEKAVKAARRK
jgi:hypothetical protein